MLKIIPLLNTQIRGIRSRIFTEHRPPYPFYFRSKGWHEMGPYHREDWQWPEKLSGWNVIPPWFPGKPEPSFADDSASQKTGYPDLSTNNYVHVDDAKPELVVPPDMEGFKLKPYVSFRTPETEADAPPLTSKDLFELFYADRIETAFKEGKYAQADDGQSLLEQEVGDKATRKRNLIEKGLPVLD